MRSLRPSSILVALFGALLAGPRAGIADGPPTGTAPAPAPPVAPAPRPAPSPVAPAPRPAPSPVAPSLPAAGPIAPPEFLLGEVALADDPVTDADTLRLAPGAPGKSVRIQSVDAEEVWHRGDDADRVAAAADFAAYVAKKQGASTTPKKYGTFAGEEAKAWTRAFLAGVSRVRLERDEPGRDVDSHGRVLAHVFLAKEGREVLFAEALVEAGWSPYFVKYGRSRRFDARLAAAQVRAREAKRGIWGDAVGHYPDYPARLAWWEGRAKQVDAWRAEVAASDGTVPLLELGTDATATRLPSLLGTKVTVFGSLERVVDDAPPNRLLLSHRPGAAFALVVFDPAIWGGIDHEAVRTRFVRATGVLTEFRGHHQLRVDDPRSIETR